MDKKQDEFEERKPIEPIPGQMCYDEFLLPEIEEEKVEKDTSIVAGQMDLWSLPPQPKPAEEKRTVDPSTFHSAQDDKNKIDKKTKTPNLDKKKVEIQEKVEQNSLAEEEQEEAEEEQNLEDETTFENDDEMTIDFENPPKKLEKTEINASKTHFFGNYENPFDE